MSDAPDQVFLIVFRTDPPLSPGHLQVIMDTVKGLSGGRYGLAFTTKDATIFGIVAKCHRSAWQIRTALDGKMPVKDKDFVMVLSLGEDWTAMGNSAGWRHIQAFLTPIK